MKTKLFVEILQHGSHNDSITKMIAGHNSGKREINLDDIRGYINCRSAEYPSLYGNTWAHSFDENDKHVENKLFITEDSGKSFTVIIEERVMVELQPEATDVFEKYLNDNYRSCAPSYPDRWLSNICDYPMLTIDQIKKHFEESKVTA